MSTARRSGAAFGTQTAASYATGYVSANVNTVENYDGTNWTTGTSTNVAKNSAGSSAMSQTSAVGMAVTAGSQSAMGRLEKSGMTKAKKGKLMIMIAIGKPKKANKGAIMKVASKLEKASKAHAGQAKTLRSLKLVRGGGAAIRGLNFQGVK